MSAAEKKATDPTKAKADTRKGFIVLGVLALVVAGCVAAAGGDDDEGSGRSDLTAAQQAAEDKRIAENEAAAAKVEQEREAAEREREAAEAAAKAAAALPPEPKDFTIAIVVLEKQCFGSAGCNVTYRIDPKYNGTRDATDLEVTYEVLGGDDPAISTFEIDSAGTATFAKRDTISTPSSKTELKARATAVRKTT